VADLRIRVDIIQQMHCNCIRLHVGFLRGIEEDMEGIGGIRLVLLDKR
jgi:hypothetical protein